MRFSLAGPSCRGQCLFIVIILAIRGAECARRVLLAPASCRPLPQSGTSGSGRLVPRTLVSGDGQLDALPAIDQR